MNQHHKRSLFCYVPRVAGQWLDQSLNDLAATTLQGYYGVIILIALALAAWAQKITGTVMDPFLFSGLAIVAGFIWTLSFARALSTAKNKRLGRDGERYTGALLDKLHELHYEVFHDFDKHYGGNIDHILVGPAGIFAIETKAKNNPLWGDKNIVFDGQKVRVNGGTYTDDIHQAQKNAKWLAGLLQQRLNREIKVFPILLFPRRWVETTDHADHANIWVLNPEQLRPRLEQRPTQMAPQDIKTIARVLAAYQKAD